MTPRCPLFVAFAGIAAVLCAPSVRAEEAAVSPAPSAASAALTAAEAVAPKDWKDAAAITANHERVIALIDGNTLQTGEDFRRAGNLLTFHKGDHRIVRMQYELLLAAAAKGDAVAESSLAPTYDSVMDRIGRPQRFDFSGWAQKNPEWTEFEAAPACIVAVWRDPAAARAAAAGATDNAEVKGIVDADQADRQGNWNTRSEAERDATQKRDLARNARIREIVAAGELHTANDFARAALVLQHSARFAGFRIAHELAVASMLLGDRGLGRWLIAATYDRMLMSVGLSQRFGTQMGPAGPIPGDEAGICDNERVALGCPTLAEARQRSQQPRAKPSQIEVSDRTLTDKTNDISVVLPENWKASRNGTASDGSVLVSLVIPDHPKASIVFYYRAHRTGEPGADPEKFLREEAVKKEAERRKSFTDYRNLPESFVFEKTGELPSLRYTAAFTRDNAPWQEYLIRIAGSRHYALLFIQAPATEVAELRASLDALAGSVKLP